MTIEQIYTGCLAQGAYYIVSEGEAAIIDPLREIQPYLDRLERDQVKLKYIFETHFHADFVSGHVDLAQKTNAKIIYGPLAEAAYDIIIAEDGQIFDLGKSKIKVLHTPGHTMESACYLLIDEFAKPTAVFTGDTLFIGDVGRPDLAQKATNLTQDQLAGYLYRSLREKVMTLPDDVIVYPAHGAGSACGKNMSNETVSTIGHQKAQNYALRADMTENDFIREVTDGLMPPPGYFGFNVAMNKQGYTSFDQVVSRGMRGLTPDEFETVAEETGSLVLDTRKNGEFYAGFVPGSINIGLQGDFAPWVGAMIVDVSQPILLVTEPGQEEEAITRLSRVGFDMVLGYLAGGFESWKLSGKECDIVNRIDPGTFAQRIDVNHDTVLDVRKESEYKLSHVKNATMASLAQINEWIKDLDNNKHFYLHCQAGYRSMIAASILQARGFRNFTEIGGGFAKIAEQDIPLESGQPSSQFSKV